MTGTELTLLRRRAVGLQRRQEALMADMDAFVTLVSRMEDAAQEATRFPEPGDLLVLDEIPVHSYIRLAGEDVLYLGYRQGVMEFIAPDGQHGEYPVTEGETFPFVSDLL